MAIYNIDDLIVNEKPYIGLGKLLIPVFHLLRIAVETFQFFSILQLYRKFVQFDLSLFQIKHSYILHKRYWYFKIFYTALIDQKWKKKLIFTKLWS